MKVDAVVSTRLGHSDCQCQNGVGLLFLERWAQETGRARSRSDISHTPEWSFGDKALGWHSSSSVPSTAVCPPFPTFVLGYQQVCVLGLHLAKELCEVDEDGDSWLQVTRRLPILPTLLTTLEVSLRMKQNLHFTEAALHLLLTLARTQQVGGC